MQLVRSFLSLFISFALVITTVATNFQSAWAQTEYQKVNCQVQSETEFRAKLETIIENVVSRSLGDIDYSKIIEASWTQYQLDKTIDELVDNGAEQIKKEKSTVELVTTLGSSNAREKLAKELAEDVYGNETFKGSLEKVAKDVAVAVSKKIDSITTQASNPITSCIKKFIGPQYGDTIALFVSQKTRQEMAVDPELSRSQTGVTDIVLDATGGLTGGLLIILRQTIVRRISRWVGQRLIGSLVTRAIGATISVLGWVLVAKELWDLRHGILPILAKEMKSDITKKRVRGELVKELDSEITKILKGIPKEISNGIYKAWINFKDDNARTLALATKYPEFAKLLVSIKSDDEAQSLSRLRKANRLVKMASEVGGEDEVLRLVRDGSLRKGVLDLSEKSIAIAIDTRSIETALKWQDISRENIDRVVELGLHKINSPKSYSISKMGKLFSLQDDDKIRAIASIDVQKREILFQLPEEQFRSLTQSLSGDDLKTLSSYLVALTPEASKSFISGIQNNPQKIKFFGRADVRHGVFRSNDQIAAIELLLRKRSALEITMLPNDIRLVSSGSISPILLWTKQPLAVIVMSLLAIFMLLLLFRLLFVRKKTIVVTNSDK